MGSCNRRKNYGITKIMKNRKVFLIICIYLLSFSLFAKGTKIKNNEIVIMGRITVICDVNRDEISKLHGLSQEQVEQGDFYSCPMTEQQRSQLEYDRQYNMSKKQVGKISNGDFFFDVAKRTEKITFSTETSRYCISNFMLFGKKVLGVLIPFPFYITVPENENACYIGSLIVHINESFEITNIELIDEFDAAKVAFEEKFNEKYSLCRVQLQTENE